MKEQFYDLSFEFLEDGTIRMGQIDYSGNSILLDAHPQQIIHIARTVSVAYQDVPGVVRIVADAGQMGLALGEDYCEKGK